MSDLIPPGVLDDRDVRSADAVIDAWLVDSFASGSTLERRLHASDLRRLRGLLAAQFSDVRAAGVLEGHQAGLVQGRREHAQELLDALMDRGLLP